MKTVITKEVDGFKVVVGFDKRLLDLVGTKKKMKDQIERTDEFKIYKRLTIKRANLELQILKKESRGIDATLTRSELLGLEKEWSKSKKDMQDKTISARKKSGTYFQPKNGEHVISEEEYQEYVGLCETAKENNSLVTYEKKIIPNKKGKSYFVKNANKITEHKIEKVGVDIPEGALTELNESDNILFQSEEWRLAAFGQEKQSLILDATLKRSELELLGKTAEEAKAEVSIYYSNKLKELELKYHQ